jgi:hypothetical protein
MMPTHRPYSDELRQCPNRSPLQRISSTLIKVWPCTKYLDAQMFIFKMAQVRRLNLGQGALTTSTGFERPTPSVITIL